MIEPEESNMLYAYDLKSTKNQYRYLWDDGEDEGCEVTFEAKLCH